MARIIERLDSVASTQDEARVRAREGFPSGTVVVADRQTGGRGRGARAWDSPAGAGIWMTLLHRSGRPSCEWPAVTSVAAWAVCRALRSFGLDPRAKWPNDLQLSGRKVCGILADTEGGALLIGIGLNLLQKDEEFPAEIRGKATSVRIELERAGAGGAPDRDALFQSLLDELGTTMEEFESEGPATALAAIWSLSSIRNRAVAILLPSGRTIRGVAVSLGPVGELAIDMGEGVIHCPNGTLTAVEGM